MKGTDVLLDYILHGPRILLLHAFWKSRLSNIVSHWVLQYLDETASHYLVV